MKYVFYIVCLLVVLIACKKDKFETTPSLTLKSTSGKVIPANAGLTIVFGFTDKEGDIKDSIFYRKIRLNVRKTPEKPDSLYYKIPPYPKAFEGEFTLNIPYNDLEAAINPLNVPGTNPVQKESDTLDLKFAIRDKEKHTSDTVVIKGVVVKRN
jgi:hypothetical protein